MMVRRPREAFLVAWALLISWIGLFAHNAAEFPGLRVTHPVNAGPLLVAVLLGAAHVARPSRVTAALVLAWGLLHLALGAVVSVLPLPFLPYAPDQALSHYASHAVYGILQVPLVVVGVRALRAARTSRVRR